MLNGKIAIQDNYKPENSHIVRYERVAINSIHSQAFLFGESNMSSMKRFVRMDNAPLCACGCGEKAKWHKWEKKWSRYLRGHHMKGHGNPNLGKDKYKFEKEKPPPLCKCGCGKHTKWDGIQWNEYIHGHNTRVRKIKFILTKEERQKQADSIRGRKLSDITRKRMSLSKKGIIFSKEHRKSLSIALTGNKLSKETKAKLSAINKGKKHSEETKQKISIGNKGKEVSKETRKKISVGNKGLKRSEEVCQKISILTSGSKNGNWKGGIAYEPYCEVWADKEYKQSIRDRDNNECQNPDCWRKCKILNIHHINYIKKDCLPSNLITLCISCNARANKNRKEHTIFYQKIMEEKYE